MHSSGIFSSFQEIVAGERAACLLDQASIAKVAKIDSHHLLGWSASLLKQPLHLRIQISRDFQSLAISIRGQEARHLVIAEVHTVWTLINQHSHRRIGPCIRDKPGH